jgi:hypothetical protein
MEHISVSSWALVSEFPVLSAPCTGTHEHFAMIKGANSSTGNWIELMEKPSLTIQVGSLDWYRVESILQASRTQRLLGDGFTQLPFGLYWSSSSGSK